jgi:RHS repeat-associated protein
VSYTSDGEGLRQTRTTSAGTTDFLWDVSGSLPLLLDDGTDTYLYGPSSAPVAQIADSGGSIQYLHGDLIGSTRLLTDSSGTVVGTTEYDAYGNRTNYTGTADSAIGYTGNWTDPTTGLVYLRARDYDPATGQFLTVDPEVDTTRQPYAYAANDPLDSSDPTGLNCRPHYTFSPSDFESQLYWQELGPEYAKDLSGFSDGLNLDALFDPSNSVAQKYRNDPGFQIEEGIGEVVSVASIVIAIKDIGVAVADSPAEAENDPAAIRVTKRVGTKQAIQAAAPRTADGDFIDPNTGKVVPAGGPFDYGHLPEYQWAKTQQIAREQGWTRQQVLDYENDPSHYVIEDPSSNRSHAFETPR